MQQKLLNNRYGISGILGSGGMAKVYLAHDEVLGRDVALKVLREQYAEDEHFVERFRREAQAAASLSHPNIVATYDRGRSEDGSYYIVMEYIPGGTLKDRIVGDGPMDPNRAADLAAQVASALSGAHERGVIHRDVKPQNVLLTASGDAKVTDFGIARAASESSLSGTSMILGTVSYMSPEQAMGKVVGPRSDLYSLGVVLHEMLAGQVPFEAETPLAVSMKHVNQPAPSISEANPGVPDGLNAVRAKLLAKSPEDRYASALDVVEDLRRVRRGEEPLFASSASGVQDDVTSILNTPLVAAGNRRRWRPFVLRTAAALVGISGLVGVFGWGLSDSEGRQPNALVEDARQIVTGSAEAPRVLGLDRAGAQQRLIGEGFEVDVRLRESSEEDAGRVLAQSIPGGEEVEKGTKVVLDVGAGPDPVPAPDLAGLSLAAAEDVLGEAGLKVGEKKEEPSETVPEGDVIEQTPPAGEEVEPGTKVDLVVSKGPAEPAPEVPVSDPPQDPAAEAEVSAAPAAPAPDQPASEPVVQPRAEPAPERYERAPAQYESAAPAVADVPEEPAPQYDAPAAQAPVQDDSPPAGQDRAYSDFAPPASEEDGFEGGDDDEGGGDEEAED